MSVIFYLIIFFIAVSLIRSLNQKPPARRGGQAERDPEQTSGQEEVPSWKRWIIRTALSSGQNEIWMQTAGQLRARYLRQDENSPFPRIRGNADGHELEITLTYDADQAPQVVYKVIFAHALKTDLTLVKTKDPAAAVSFCQGSKPISLTGALSSIPGILCAGNEPEQIQSYIAAHQDILLELFRKFETVFLNGYGCILKMPNAITPRADLMQSLLQAVNLMTDETTTVSPAENEVKPSEPSPAPAPKPVSASPAIKPAVSATISSAPSKTMPSSTPSFAVPKKEPVVPAQTAQPVDTSDDTGIHTLAPLLFSAGFPGAKEKAAFDAVKGKRVCWTGKLRSAYEFSSDFTFGPHKGIKATFEIMELEGTCHSKCAVKAVVELPPQEISGLRAATNQTMTFEGTLLKFEGFAKEIYLKEGNLKK